MDFRVTVSTKDNVRETKSFEQFSDAINYITEKMSYWNNFAPEEPIYFEIIKVLSDTDTLGVNVADEMDIADLFGRV